MAAAPFDTHWRKTLVRAAMVLGLAPMFACAEIEVGIEAAKRVNRALAPADRIQVAQAATPTQQEATTAQPPISPYLEPAPTIFEASGLALWDGKRTLQGIWVAHPLATTARRVRIFNEVNGQAVDGALFKRDTAQGGPSVLISSEAASMLGLVPGESTELRIVAVTPVRRDETTIASETPQPVDETATPVENETLDQGTATEEGQPTDPTVTQDEATSEDTTDTADQTVQDSPTNETEAEAEAAATTPLPVTTEAENPAETTLAAVPTPAPRPKPLADPSDTQEGATFKWDSAAEAAEESAARDPKPLDQAGREPSGEGTDGQATPAAKPEPAQQVAAAKPEPAQPAPQPSSLRRPFVQAGVFGVPSNATNLVARLKKKGIPALTRKAGGKLTRVLAGPFKSKADRTAALIAIRNLGLRDAVPVKR